MALKHNKKRNSGMLNEFFSMFIADALVSRRYDKISAVNGIWKKHVFPGSEIQKEMQLFEAIFNKSYSSKEVAFDLLSKVKKIARKLNSEKLEREKTSLIREVNQSFDSQGFFDRQIKNYTELASFQILINYYSSKRLNENVINPAIAEIEDKLISFMTRENVIQEVKEDGIKKVMSLTESEVDGLVINIMKEKLNNKFAPRLTENQKSILKQYVFDSHDESLKETLNNLRDETLGLIEEELKRKDISNSGREKLSMTKEMLQEDYKNTSSINEDFVVFYMTVSKLNEELKDKD